jgi:citrate lyase alpha subunit
MSSTKRKSNASTSTSAKKARIAHTAAIESVRSILLDTSNFAIPESADGTRRVLLELAQYARSLEEQVVASKPKEKTLEEVKAAAEKLCAAARSGIRKQMTVSFRSSRREDTRLTRRLVETILQNWFSKMDI